MIDADDLLSYLPHFRRERHLEKDYLQDLLLEEIYSELSTELIFKGGTALQKVYGLGRFSEDLDFTYGGADLAADEKKLSSALARLDEQYPFNLHPARRTGDSVTVELRNIRGPLYPTREVTHTIKIDVSLRERAILKPELKYMAPMYRDMKPFSVYVMDIREILAEKARAVLTRLKARDVYDIFFLLKYRDVKFERSLADAKLEGQKIKFSKAEFMRRIDGIGEKLWNEELSETVDPLPQYAEVVSYIRKSM